MTTWKGRAFEREWHRAMIEWIDGGRVGRHPKHSVQISYGPDDSYWRDASSEPSFSHEAEYRWAPKPKRTVTINGKTLVAPEVDAPADKSKSYFYIDAWGLVCETRAYPVLPQFLSTGNVFLAREDAQAMADWLVKCRRGET